MDSEKREKCPPKPSSHSTDPMPDASKDSTEEKNRGWPKGKKRYPKLPGAPKQPLSGYVHFLNYRRENLRKECPEISFAEISKKLATEWSQLVPEEKQKYMEIAEQDKERYVKEFADYQQTDAYKKYLQTQQKEQKKEKEATVAPLKKKMKKQGKMTNDDASNVREDPAASVGLDFPVFTEEFLEYNKARESELRQLRKQVTEMEEQNAILYKHVENMQSAIGKLEMETGQQQENSAALTKHLDALRQMIVGSFQGVNLPGRVDPITLNNVDEFMKHIHTLVGGDKAGSEEQALVTKVREVLAKMDYAFHS